MKKLNYIMVITCFILLFNIFTSYQNIVHAETNKELIPTVHNDVVTFEDKSSYNALKTGILPNGVSVSVNQVPREYLLK